MDLPNLLPAIQVLVMVPKVATEEVKLDTVVLKVVMDNQAVSCSRVRFTLVE